VTVLLALVVGFLVGRLLLLGLLPVLSSPILERKNYRGQTLPTAGGIVIVVTVVAIEGVRVLAHALGVGDVTTNVARHAVLLTVVGFGFFGFLDDVLGDGDARGFRGHLAALRRGHVTTGTAKLIGGASLALTVAALAGARHGQLLVDAALIALASNLANLLDVRPGRTAKYALVGYVPVALLCGTDTLGVAIAPVMGALLACLPDELRERYMLGDTGANPVGAVLGLAVVLEVSPGARIVVAIGLLALNLLSEVVSFSRVIERVGPLRAFDRLGRGFVE
jgi:UDP-N-acetylmuramyl pentapeptide phosphotransferase/UDP-N-acetylglucosamine-1-phosphate transferase